MPRKGNHLQWLPALKYVYNLNVMYNDQKIGVGIVTCNREQSCQQLFDAVKSAGVVDQIVVVKNKDFDYSGFIKHIEDDTNTKLIVILDEFGVGYCKNEAFKYLLSKSCEHIFLIEDDTVIKNVDVFKKYIDTAKAFNIGHLTYGGCSPFKQWRQPIAQIANQDIQIDFYHHVKGEFCYYSSNALQMVGLMDEMYINAVEHIEHTYRLMKFGYCCGCFWAFPDIANSELYLYNPSCEQTYHGTIDPSTDAQKKNVRNAYQHFYDVYHFNFCNFPNPTFNDIANSTMFCFKQHRHR